MTNLYTIIRNDGVRQTGFMHLPPGWVVVGSALAQGELASAPGDVFVTAAMHRTGLVVACKPRWIVKSAEGESTTMTRSAALIIRTANGAEYERGGDFQAVINEIDITLGGTGRAGVVHVG